MWSLPSSAGEHAVKYDVNDAFKFACSVMQYDCSNIPVPTVVVDPIRPTEDPEDLFELLEGKPCANGNLWGYTAYDNPNNEVHLCAGSLYTAVPEFVQSVLAHEITHYLDAKVYGDSSPEANGCQTEWNGHRVGNAYVVSHGRPDLADFDWQDWYNCYKGDQDNGDIRLDWWVIQTR